MYIAVMIAVGGREHLTLVREIYIMLTIALRVSPRGANNLPSRTQAAPCKMYLPLGIIRMRIDKIQNGPFAHLGPRNLSSRSPKSLSTKLRTPATRHADLCKYLSPAALP